MRTSGLKEKEQIKEKQQTETGIKSFFERPSNTDCVTSETARVPSSFAPLEVPIVNKVKPKPTVPRIIKERPVKIVDPPPFHPIRATATDETFVDPLKIREFVLQCNSLF